MADLIKRIIQILDEPLGTSYSPDRSVDWYEWHEGSIDDDEPARVIRDGSIVFRGTFAECKSEFLRLNKRILAEKIAQILQDPDHG